MSSAFDTPATTGAWPAASHASPAASAAAAVVQPNVASGVSWGAILAGAAGAAALSLILLLLGTGLGLSSVSPWSGRGASGTAVGIGTVLWLTLTQVAASGLGGYLAGRLRSRWTAVHADEVYFRDTAHGFLAWAVATLVTAAVLTSAIASALGATAQAGASVAGGAVSSVTGAATTGAAAAVGAAGANAASNAGSNEDSGGGQGPMAYLVDSLFRPAPAQSSAAAPAAAASGADASASAPAATASAPEAAPSSSSSPAGDTPQQSGQPMTAQATAEAGRILLNAVREGSLPADDLRYLGAMVAARTGMTQQAAEQRITTSFNRMKEKADQAATKAREAADEARKASAKAALWMFVSLLLGAFVASLAATFGGRQRDA